MEIIFIMKYGFPDRLIIYFNFVLKKVNEPESNIHEVQIQQSLRELKYLNNYRHDNILPLYGYSLTHEKPCLVYQFMKNGSLEDRIQCRVCNTLFTDT